jgi:hypothetical protein
MLQLSKVDWFKGMVALVALAAIAGVAIVVSVIITWRSSRRSDPLNTIQPGVYQSHSNSGETLPVPAPR